MNGLRGNNPKIIEIDGKTVGYEEGATCNRLVDDGDNGPYMCDGTIELEDGEDCSCHLSAPCGYCMDRQLVCNSCGERVEE